MLHLDPSVVRWQVLFLVPLSKWEEVKNVRIQTNICTYFLKYNIFVLYSLYSCQFGTVWFYFAI